jgi:hypothetical protein
MSLAVIPWPPPKLSVEDSVYECSLNLHNLIEALFDLTPGIASLRNLFMVFDETRLKHPERLSALRSSVVQSPSQSIVRDDQKHVNPSLPKRVTKDGARLAEVALRTAQAITENLQQKGREERLSKDKSMMEHIASLFAEETARLSEWKKRTTETPMSEDVSSILLKINLSLSGETLLKHFYLRSELIRMKNRTTRQSAGTGRRPRS